MIDARSKVEKLIAETMQERGVDRAAAASWLQTYEAARWDAAFVADAKASIERQRAARAAQ